MDIFLSWCRWGKFNAWNAGLIFYGRFMDVPIPPAFQVEPCSYYIMFSKWH
ncbi:MAG: hypothetical protein NT178_09955 [Proteobacteria bacterium]|nr:hypothetical protein [Pseudomonadota bacterium]